MKTTEINAFENLDFEVQTICSVDAPMYEDADYGNLMTTITISSSVLV
ncbi:hypothetical protein [Sphingobacterium olei]|nr:hypothetical protein [Sphingobacterium olei]